MSTICSHTDNVELTELTEVIAGCEDCLAVGEHGCTWACVSPAAASHAAIARRIGTPRPSPRLAAPDRTFR